MRILHDVYTHDFGLLPSKSGLVGKTAALICADISEL